MRLAAHFAQAAGVASIGYPLMKPARRRLALQRWSAKLVRHLATRLTVHGEPPRDAGAPFMLVSNHVSWLDIFAINAAVPTRFVAKSEIRGWPLAGWLCVKADTLIRAGYLAPDAHAARNSRARAFSAAAFRRRFASQGTGAAGARDDRGYALPLTHTLTPALKHAPVFEPHRRQFAAPYATRIKADHIRAQQYAE